MSTLKTTNLQHEASATPNIVLDSTGGATIANPNLTGNIDITGDLDVTGNLNVTNNLSVTGDVTGGLDITGNLDVTGDVQATSFNGGQLGGMRNRIINGDMRIAQRGTNAVTGSSYPVDRWLQGVSTSGAVSAQYETASTPTGFQTAIKLTTTTADATTDPTDQWNVQQIIEGFNSADLLFGTANAQNVTVSFWVRSSVTGTFCMTLLGSSDGSTIDRSYVSEYTISSADTWEKKTITVPGDTGGTWTTDNGRGLAVRFGLTAGTNFQQTAGSWNTSNVVGSPNQTQLLETLNATWYVTGVQLELGPVATPFEYRPIGTELALCQRYYQIGRYNQTLPYANSSITQSYTTSVNWITQMRATPTVTGSNNQGTFSAGNVSVYGCTAGRSNVATNRQNSGTVFANAEFS